MDHLTKMLSFEQKKLFFFKDSKQVFIEKSLIWWRCNGHFSLSKDEANWRSFFNFNLFIRLEYWYKNIEKKFLPINHAGEEILIEAIFSQISKKILGFCCSPSV